MTVDFKKALSDSGVPTTDAQLKQAWEKLAVEQGSTLSNTSAYSPFWRIITALVTKPVLWLLEFVSGTVLPNFFVKTAGAQWLDMLAWAVNIERKAATVATGELLFTRANTGGELEVPIGTVVQSPTLNGHIYQLVTTEPRSFEEGQSQLVVPVKAVGAGSGYNLAPGYYAVLPQSVPGIVQVVNNTDWLQTPGADSEHDDQLRLRVRNQFSAVNQWHTDAVYRAIITGFPGWPLTACTLNTARPVAPAVPMLLCCSTPACLPTPSSSRSTPISGMAAIMATATICWRWPCLKHCMRSASMSGRWPT